MCVERLCSSQSIRASTTPTLHVMKLVGVLTHVHMYTCIRVCTHTPTCVCVYACTCVYKYKTACTSTYAHTYAYHYNKIYTTSTYAHTLVYRHTQTCRCTHVQLNMCIQTTTNTTHRPRQRIGCRAKHARGTHTEQTRHTTNERRTWTRHRL